MGIVPSVWHEAFGLVGTEFLQARIPIIVSDTCGVAEVIENGKTGFIFESGKTDSLLEKMKLIVTESELISKFQMNQTL